MPVSATWSDSATWAGVVTFALVEPVRGLLSRLNRNISVRIRDTIVFTTVREIVPSLTA